MNIDTWFHSQSKLIQIILLIIPFVGWIVDVLVRLSAYLKNKSTVGLIMTIVVLVFGFSWILTILDALWIALYNKLLLEE